MWYQDYETILVRTTTLLLLFSIHTDSVFGYTGAYIRFFCLALPVLNRRAIMYSLVHLFFFSVLCFCFPNYLLHTHTYHRWHWCAHDHLNSFSSSWYRGFHNAGSRFSIFFVILSPIINTHGNRQLATEWSKRMCQKMRSESRRIRNPGRGGMRFVELWRWGKARC